MSDPVAALRAGEPVILPTDTVYGLCADAANAAAVERMYALKGRGAAQPTALLAADVDALLALVPELPEPLVRRLLPGAYTLILPNPARRYPWLTGANPDAIGVRVVSLPAEAGRAVAAVGCVAATSANSPGGPDPRRIEDVPPQLRSGAGAIVDAGELPGIASTVVDFTGAEPRVLREGAGPVDVALSAAGA